MQCGLNLYSVRNLFSDKQSLLEVCQSVKQMGYTYLQVSGIKIVPEELKEIVEATGLPFVLTHAPIDDILNRTDELVEEHKQFGCYNIGLGMMPMAALKDEKLFKDTALKLEEAAKKIEAGGCKFFYHFHHYEFVKRNGQRMIDFMIENCPHVNFTADTYWIQYGGCSVEDYLKKMAGRIECIHLKDYQVVFGEDKCEPKYAPVGVGNIDLKHVSEIAKQCGTKYFLVEQDDAVDYPDPLAQVEISAKQILSW